MKAQYGKELEVREYLQKLKARALSSEEPDTLEYRVAEYDGTFALWETYKSSAALKKWVFHTLFGKLTHRPRFTYIFRKTYGGEPDLEGI